jgi:hypothetical protein
VSRDVVRAWRDRHAQIFGYLARNLVPIATALNRLPVMPVQQATDRKTKKYRNAPTDCEPAPAQEHAADGLCYEHVNSANK